MNEPMLAAAARRHQPHPPGAVAIDANENPLGPCQAARDAMAEILPHGGRYSDELTDELVKTFAQMEGLNPDYVTATVGSTPPLAVSVLACTSPQRPYVTADPGFELGMNMASNNGVRVVKVPLTKTYAHDVKAMLAAAPDAASDEAARVEGRVHGDLGEWGNEIVRRACCWVSPSLATCSWYCARYLS